MTADLVKERLISLDVFRGITIASMVLVNTPGSWSYVYPPLAHAEWHGFTPTDLVFPFFLFAIGASMSFSFLKYLESPKNMVIKIVRRTFLIILIAYLVKLFPFQRFDFENMRIMGVLHRIALAYFFAALLCYFLNRKILSVVSIGILLLYWILLLAFGTGDPFSLEGNAVLKFDKFVLGENHLWRGLGIPFDPEGLLSTLPAIVSVIAGYLTGVFIQQEKNKGSLLNYSFLIGNGLIFIALLWDMVFPINKSLWTSSYVLMSTGIALVLVGFLIYFLDIKKLTGWANPFIVMGKNPLMLYIMSILIVKIYVMVKTPDGNAYSWLYKQVFVPLAGNLNGSLLFALVHVGIIWLIGWALDKKGIIIKV